MSSQLGTSGAITASTWTTVDVPAYITGNGSYNFAFNTTSSTTLRLRREELRLRSGREGTNAPELVIETSTGGAITTVDQRCGCLENPSGHVSAGNFAPAEHLDRTRLWQTRTVL